MEKSFMNEPEVIQQVIAVLGGDQGWVARVVAWMGTLRLVSKLFSTHLENFLTAACAASADDPWFRRKLQRILASRPYKVLAFLVDYFLSIKLPKNEKSPPRRDLTPTDPGSFDRLRNRPQRTDVHPPEGGEGG